jgi:hypothetical protein
MRRGSSRAARVVSNFAARERTRAEGTVATSGQVDPGRGEMVRVSAAGAGPWFEITGLLDLVCGKSPVVRSRGLIGLPRAAARRSGFVESDRDRSIDQVRRAPRARDRIAAGTTSTK